MFYFIFILKDFELIDLNRFKKINELKLSSELLDLLDMTTPEDKKDYDVEYMKTTGSMNSSIGSDEVKDTEFLIDSETKTVYPGIYINTKTGNTIKTIKDSSSGSRKGSEFNVAQHEIFLEYFLKNVFPEDNSFFSQSINVVKDDPNISGENKSRPHPTYFKMKKQKDNKNPEKNTIMNESFKLPIDYSKIPIEIIKSIYNPLETPNLKYYYPIDKKDDYDVEKIKSYKEELVNDYIKSDKIENEIKEKKNELKNELKKNANDIYLSQSGSDKLSLEEIEKNIEKRNEDMITTLKNKMKLERRKLLDNFLIQTIQKINIFISNVAREKKVSLSRNNTVVYLISYKIQLEKSVDDPNRLLNITQNKELNIIKSVKTIKDEIALHVEEALDCRKAKKEYKNIVENFLSYLTGMDEYKNRTQTYYNIPVLNVIGENGKIKNDEDPKIKENYEKLTKPSPETLKDKSDFIHYNYKDHHIEQLAKKEIESILYYLYKNNILLKMYDSEENEVTSYNQMDPIKTYFKIKDESTYSSYFKSLKDKRPEKELNKVSMNPLDYIMGVYQNDRDLVKDIAREIGDQRVYTPSIPDVWNYITSNDEEKKKIRQTNKSNNNQKGTSEPKTLRDIINGYVGS